MAEPPITERHKPHFHRVAPVKELCRAATTANITISTALNNGDTIDGITLATGDRVLVKNQSTDSQNGIYVVGVTPVRAYDQSTDDPSYGFLVLVLQGTANAGTLWKNTNTSAPTIGSTSITFAQFSSGGATFGTPAIVLGTAAAAGSIDEAIRRDSTIVAFDATNPTTAAIGDSPATGSAAVAARRDHGHGMPGFAGSGSASSVAHSDHTHGAGGGTSGVYPLDNYAIDGTYGDDFTGSSLSGSWTRRNFTSGAESYQQGISASWLRVSCSGRANGDGYFRTAPGGDWTFALKLIQWVSGIGLGLCVVDTNGTGVALIPSYVAGSPLAPLLVNITTYSTYGGTYYEPWIASASPNVSLYQTTPINVPMWFKLRKSSTSYYAAFSLNGDTWSGESGAMTWSGTVDRVGMILVPPNSAPLTTTTNDVDWFNKIA